jgi:CBS domain-containing protein
MAKAFDGMTRSLATCGPDARVADVAASMRERHIGAVLVLKNGELQGIPSERGLASQAWTGGHDPLQAPLSEYLSAPILTDEADWSLERVCEVMALLRESMRQVRALHRQMRAKPDEQPAGVAALLARPPPKRFWLASSEFPG